MRILHNLFPVLPNDDNNPRLINPTPVNEVPESGTSATAAKLMDDFFNTMAIDSQAPALQVRKQSPCVPACLRRLVAKYWPSSAAKNPGLSESDKEKLGAMAQELGEKIAKTYLGAQSELTSEEQTANRPIQTDNSAETVTTTAVTEVVVPETIATVQAAEAAPEVALSTGNPAETVLAATATEVAVLESVATAQATEVTQEIAPQIPGSEIAAPAAETSAIVVREDSQATTEASVPVQTAEPLPSSEPLAVPATPAKPETAPVVDPVVVKAEPWSRERLRRRHA